MSLGIVQHARGGAVSGTAFNLKSNVTAGNAVVLVVTTGGRLPDGTGWGKVLSVSGLGASWTSIAQENSAGRDIEIWIGTGATGGTEAITVTTAGITWAGHTVTPNNYGVWAFEISGGFSSVGSTATALSPTASLTFTGLTPGGLIFAVATHESVLSNGPPWPWVVYLDGGSGLAIAGQLAGDSSDQTASWTCGSRLVWAMSGAVLTPTQ